MGQYCFARWRLSSSSVTLLADRRHHLNTHYLQQASKSNLATSSFASDTTVHVYKLNLLTYLLTISSQLQGQAPDAYWPCGYPTQVAMPLDVPAAAMYSMKSHTRPAAEVSRSWGRRRARSSTSLARRRS